MKFPPDKLVLPLFGVVFIAALILASGIRLEEDFMALIPGELRRNGDYRKILDTFKPMDQMIVLVSLEDDKALPPDTLPEERLAACSDELHGQMESSGQFRHLLYRWGFADYEKTSALLESRRIQLYDEKDLARLEGLRDYPAMLALMEDWKREIYTSSDPFVIRQLQNDPLKLGGMTAAKWNGLGSFGDLTLYEGRVITGDGRNIVILAEPIPSGSDSRAAERFVAGWDRDFRLLEEKYPGIKIHWMAGHRYTFENARRIKRDVGLTVSLSLLFVLALALFSYRRPVFSLLSLLPSLFGFTVALAVCRVFWQEVSGIIVGCGSMIIGITVDYGTHVLFHVDDVPRGDGFRRQVFDNVRAIRNPLALCALTTTLSFAVLLLSKIPGYRQLGLFSCMGVSAALAFVVFATPRLIPQPLKKPLLPPLFRPDATRFWNALFDTLTRRRRIVLVLAAVVLALAVPGIFRVRFDGNISSLNAKSAAMVSDEALITDKVNPGYHDTYVAVPGSTGEEALTALVPVEAELDAMVQEGLAESYAGILPVLPPEGLQRQRFDRWIALTEGGLVTDLTVNLVKAADATGLKGSLLAPALEPLSRPVYSPLTQKDFTGTILEPVLRNRLAGHDGKYLALTMVRVTDPANLETVRDRLFTLNPGIILYNEKIFAVEILDLIYSEMKRLGLIIAAVIVCLVLLFTRSVRKGAATLLPILYSFVLAFGLFGWLNIPINLMNCLVLIFIFGLVIDNSIFMVSALWDGYDREAFRNTSSRAVVMSALTNMAGLGVLVLATHPALKALGSAAIIGITCGLVSIFALSPALTTLFNRKPAAGVTSS